MKALLIVTTLLLAAPQTFAEENVHSLNYVAPQSADGVDAENLTDQQKVLSESYVHEGLSQRQKEELCGGNEEACSGESASVFGQTEDQMVSALAKAYTMVLGVGDGKIEMGPKTGDAASTAQTNTSTTNANTETPTEGREVNDYCKYVAVAGEAIGTVKQTMDQQNLENAPVNADTAQKELLYKAARSHGTRAETAKIQAYSWGGTAGCYTGMIAYSAYTGGAASAGTTFKSLWMKLGASTLLAGFYTKLVGEHESYEKKVKDIADQLPGKGDCNPITQLNCYCAQPETEYDPQYCATGLNEKKLETGDVRVTCINSRMESDTACECDETDSCLDKKFVTDLSGLGFGTNFVQSNGDTMKGLVTGRVLSGDLAEASLNRNAQKAKDALVKGTKSIPPVKLTEEQQREAEIMGDFGIPMNVASRIAATPVDSKVKSAQAKIKALVQGTSKGVKKAAATKKNEVMYFGGNGGKKAVKKAEKKFNPFAQFNKKNKDTTPGNEVLRFQQMAKADAQISNDKDTSIFEIISRRYQVSGQRRLFGNE